MPKAPKDAPIVTWEQTRAFRLQRQRLTDPVGPRSFLKVVRELGGVQAQVASAGEIQIALRAPGLKPGAIGNALLEDRSLVKTWLMRGTLHYLAAEDLATWTSASATVEFWNKSYWERNFGIKEKDIHAASDAALAVLSDKPVTRVEIADAIYATVKHKGLDDLVRAGWGSFLKILSRQGKLCFGPPAGRNVTFVSPKKWISGWKEVDRDAALREVLFRYLATHGPASREEFARWWGFAAARLNDMLKNVRDELVVLNRDGEAVYVLKKDVKALEKASEDDELRLLGMFDAYVLAGLPHDAIVPKKNKDKVYTTGAWVQRTILRGGHVVGVWRPAKKGGGYEIDLFDRSATKKQVSDLIEGFPVPSLNEVTPEREG